MLRTEEIGDSYIMNYRYDPNGTLVAVSISNLTDGSSSILFAQTNTRGDVVSLYNSSGVVKVNYVYDSWGKLLSATDGNGNALAENSVGALNAIRYRGYVYDSETGLYYLQSRYYDPETGRFLNADDFDYLGISGSVLSYNAFAYCENNAVNDSDPEGFAPSAKWIGFGIQFEISASIFGLSGCVGLEFVWYTSSQVKLVDNKSKPYAYWYITAGISISEGKDILEILIRKISKNPKGIFEDKLSVGVSACAFAIKGYTNSQEKYYKFSKPSDYTGAFSTKGVTINHIKGYRAKSSCCVVYGVGGDISKFAAGVLDSNYFFAYNTQKLINKVCKFVNQIKTESNKVKKL